MKRILLNILEIKKAAKNIKDAEILLTFALAIGPNKIISNNFYNLKEKLKIDNFPQFLITKGYFDKYPDKIVSRFTIEEPQCYMTNGSWLHYSLPTNIKRGYEDDDDGEDYQVSVAASLDLSKKKVRKNNARSRFLSEGGYFGGRQLG